MMTSAICLDIIIFCKELNASMAVEFVYDSDET